MAIASDRFHHPPILKAIKEKYVTTTLIFCLFLAALMILTTRNSWLSENLSVDEYFLGRVTNIGKCPLHTEKHFGALARVREKRKLMELPVGLKYQSKDEVEYLKLHKCMDHGEVYSASYLITKEHMMKHKIDYNLSECNTELASFMVTNN